MLEWTKPVTTGNPSDHHRWLKLQVDSKPIANAECKQARTDGQTTWKHNASDPTYWTGRVESGKPNVQLETPDDVMHIRGNGNVSVSTARQSKAARLLCFTTQTPTYCNTFPHLRFFRFFLAAGAVACVFAAVLLPPADGKNGEENESDCLLPPAAAFIPANTELNSSSMSPSLHQQYYIT